MNQQPENPFARILSLLLLVAGAVIVSRFLLLLRPFVFVSLLVLGMLAWLGYRLYERRRERREAEAFATSVQGIIQRRLRECETGIAANSAEIQEITSTVKELERELLELDGASEEKVRETRRLIEAFQAEKKLREAKLAFLQTALQRLHILEHNYRLSATIVEKQEQLKRLQAKNYEDLANLEELRSNIEYDRAYLETLDELSTRMIGSQSINDVRALRRELDTMTRELNDKDAD